MFDFNNVPPGITALGDQAEAAINEMPEDVRTLLVGQYIDAAMMGLIGFHQQLYRVLQPVMSEVARDWFKDASIEVARDLAKANLIQQQAILPLIKPIIIDTTLAREQWEIDDTKAEELAEYILKHEALFLQVFRQIDDFKIE